MQKTTQVIWIEIENEAYIITLIKSSIEFVLEQSLLLYLE